MSLKTTAHLPHLHHVATCAKELHLYTEVHASALGKLDRLKTAKKMKSLKPSFTTHNMSIGVPPSET